MGHARGRVTEIRLEAGMQVEAFITCPPGMVPQPGQYVLASDPTDPDAALGTPLFTVEISVNGFWAAPPIPTRWRPGTELALTGPLGHGINLPRDILRLGLVSLGETVSRLMPLIHQPGNVHRNITLFTDLALPSLPSFVEAYPAAALAEMLDWPDHVVIDIPLERLVELRSLLKFRAEMPLSTPAQVLVTAPMPCAALGRCGACAVPAQRGWKLVCEDGPVFPLSVLKW